ncbi:MAG: ribose-phosphate diphosphokinase [Candidatus Korarchaeota archaeon]|nr:ribose-phosphate diphosphokinase [Candidatus Korarchaeota archaeon]NIU83970.1 ribose-phosphate diphosphokinase [Candidatus Thorarchaeota archaeon]NIW14094.1 ribose-phosphate diphosphokinase [Candidatus Thorarchaeota archaeon]NIW52204.1 ribose-phosphate diphosphokinase [Candidatus Korarchaeota archaeon]
MKLIIDPAYQGLAFELAKEWEVLRTDFKRFPDGELYFRFKEPVEGENVSILVAGYPHQDRAILRTVLLSRTLRDLGANAILGIIPYFPYARQDKRFRSGEPISAKAVAESLFESGVNKILTVDVHSEGVFAEFGGSFMNLSSIGRWADYLTENLEGDFFLIAPDQGRSKTVRRLAQKAACDFITLSKERNLETGEIEDIVVKQEKLQKLSKQCEVAILFDDIISTGGTASTAIQEVHKAFEGDVIAAFTHGLFQSGSISKLLRAGTDKILTTDTVNTSYSDVSVAPLLSRKIKEITKQ